jgi:hypothetical protein
MRLQSGLRVSADRVCRLLSSRALRRASGWPFHKNCLWTVRERLGTLGPEVAPTLCRSPKLPESESMG